MKRNDSGQTFDSTALHSLKSLLEKQCGFYRVVLELSRNEYEKFSSFCSLNEIIPIMKKKKILLSCIDEIEEEIGPIKEKWWNYSCDLSESSPAVAEILSEIESLVAEVLAIDEVNQKFLSKYMKALADKKEKLSHKQSKKES